MKKHFLLGCTLVASSFLATAQEPSNSIDSLKILSQEETDWFALKNDYFVFYGNKVHDLGWVKSGSIIEIKCYGDKNNPYSNSPSGGNERKLTEAEFRRSKDSKFVSAKTTIDGGLSMILLAGDVPGNYMETVSGVTVMYRVSKEYINK